MAAAKGMAFLSKMAKTTTTKAKNETPTIEIPNTEENTEAFSTWVEEKRKEKNAESIRKQQESILRPLAEQARQNYCQVTGTFHSSVKVKVTNSDLPPLLLVCQNKYSKITPDKQAALEEIFGEQDYEKYFRLHTGITLTEKAMREIEKDDKLINKLMEAVGGAERFSEYFEVEQFIEPKDVLHELRTTDEEVAKKAKLAIDDDILKPTTPSFKE